LLSDDRSRGDVPDREERCCALQVSNGLIGLLKTDVEVKGFHFLMESLYGAILNPCFFREIPTT